MKLPPSLRGGFQDMTTDSSRMFSITGKRGGSGRSGVENVVLDTIASLWCLSNMSEKVGGKERTEIGARLTT